MGDALDAKTVIETMNLLGVTADSQHCHDLDFMRDSSTSEERSAATSAEGPDRQGIQSAGVAACLRP
ncbi:hypothetical protein ABID08_001414 [Rhizobium binae]|uniref:Uncharacterized protein n=1 Tax=Rhizobium binae TaxID=1138190 RepID=A0ABV2MC82_9HYPH|nr:hypothetical protein [Rhizobium binae]NKL47928.1 hypothetical protein [Rhizobium leguminosarum bv. viciae]MBX4929554.1 hypothetical protein [Rhizobium binae]MBX4967635.1 hypothetical protein [Rhizobium binae]MBX4990364.1 hypothetical protein [Rhizobium binae]QSY82559.1 hypothetical protein J2J99_01665 [Rhizobium binae]